MELVALIILTYILLGGIILGFTFYYYMNEVNMEEVEDETDVSDGNTFKGVYQVVSFHEERKGLVHVLSKQLLKVFGIYTALFTVTAIGVFYLLR